MALWGHFSQLLPLHTLSDTFIFPRCPLFTPLGQKAEALFILFFCTLGWECEEMENKKGVMFLLFTLSISRPLSCSSNQNKNCVLPTPGFSCVASRLGKNVMWWLWIMSLPQSIIFIWVLKYLIHSFCLQFITAFSGRDRVEFTFSFLLHPFCLSNICCHLTHPSTGVSF